MENKLKIYGNLYQKLLMNLFALDKKEIKLDLINFAYFMIIIKNHK